MGKKTKGNTSTILRILKARGKRRGRRGVRERERQRKINVITGKGEGLRNFKGSRVIKERPEKVPGR